MNISGGFNTAGVPTELLELFDQAASVLRAFFPDGEVPEGIVVLAGERALVTALLEHPLSPVGAEVPRAAVVLSGAALARGIAAWAERIGGSAPTMAAPLCRYVNPPDGTLRALTFVFPMDGGFHVLSPTALQMRWGEVVERGLSAPGGSA